MEADVLKGKKILIVDDEPDILETLVELLDMCNVDTAPNFDTAQKFLKMNTYDVAILDIMGVRGYDLLEITQDMGIPALMLTAHALSPDNLIKSLKGGAHSYIPKDKIAEIEQYVAEIIKSQGKGVKKSGQWFTQLKPFFDSKFGPDWQEREKEFWKEFNQKFVASKEDVENILR